jgi:RND family efflux transporter MFP subunit
MSGRRRLDEIHAVLLIFKRFHALGAFMLWQVWARMRDRFGRLLAGCPVYFLATGILLLFSGVSSASVRAATFDCVMDPALSLKLGSPVASILQSVEVDRGDLVKAGQVVARLESAVETAVVALDQVKSESLAEVYARQVRVELTKIAFGRQISLQERQNTSAQKVDEARADYQSAQQDLALAQLNHRVAELELQRARAAVEQRAIRSPIDGVVVQRSLGPGEYVNQDAHIITVAKIDPLHVETFLPIRFYGTIKVGDSASVRPDDPVGGDRKAAVSVVDQVFDAASGTFGIRLDLPNPDGMVPAGLRCRVTFTLPENDSASTP